MKNIFKSIGAILLGMIIVIILSYGTDALLRGMGIMQTTLPMYGSVPLILAVITYRSIYNVIGSYVIARFAPNHPMTHVLIVGVLGFVGGLAGTFAAMHTNAGPAWYGLSVAFLSIPTAWLGGRLFVVTNNKGVKKNG